MAETIKTIVEGEPLAGDHPSSAPTLSKTGESLAPTTTAQQDMVTAGQRRVNIIWENTQRLIAVSVVTAALFVDMFITVASFVFKTELSVTQLFGATSINGLAMLVVGFYFARTNHAAIGGVGAKPLEEYKGR